MDFERRVAGFLALQGELVEIVNTALLLRDTEADKANGEDQGMAAQMIGEAAHRAMIALRGLVKLEMEIEERKGSQ